MDEGGGKEEAARGGGGTRSKTKTINGEFAEQGRASGF